MSYTIQIQCMKKCTLEKKAISLNFFVDITFIIHKSIYLKTYVHSLPMYYMYISAYLGHLSILFLWYITSIYVFFFMVYNIYLGILFLWYITPIYVYFFYGYNAVVLGQLGLYKSSIIILDRYGMID